MRDSCVRCTQRMHIGMVMPIYATGMLSARQTEHFAIKFRPRTTLNPRLTHPSLCMPLPPPPLRDSPSHPPSPPPTLTFPSILSTLPHPPPTPPLPPTPSPTPPPPNPHPPH